MRSVSAVVADATNDQCNTYCNSRASRCYESSALCPIVQSMNYLSNVLASGLQFPKATETPKTLEKQVSTNGLSSFSVSNEIFQGEAHHNEGLSSLSHLECRRPTMVKHKTTLRFAHPPPISKHQQRFNIRPRRVLQLQKLCQDSRPKPFLDVLRSSSHLSYPPIRLLRHGKGKASRYGPEDLVVVNSPAYDEPDIQSAGTSDTDPSANHDFVALICRTKDEPGQRLSTSIQMSDGTSWRGCRLRSGNYELSKEDKRGGRTVVRWVRKRKTPAKPQRSRGDMPVEDQFEGNTFTFSIIDPNVRRHAIIASLSTSSMEICDSYSSPPILTSSYSESSRSDRSDILQHDSQESFQGTMKMVDDDLKAFIAISGVWVALSEGHSPIFKYDPREAAIKLGQDGTDSERSRSLSTDLAPSIAIPLSSYGPRGSEG